ncbi:hypothetical protein CYMTET_17681 [Cymbomonas tetramitiformis]|uniref:Cyclic nucleotide-binding domain-containing protein n=1 Tax=Cymbomonas tetramitiformis TaxID=36881 RepID=A0AAE0GA34_9CHLO|nr:hypothetical protein CYMTET_17681 [Cymbomonas tetramitiformis]
MRDHQTLLSSCLGEESLQPVRSKVILERKPSLIAAMHATHRCFGGSASLAELEPFTDIITLAGIKNGEQILLKGQKAECFMLILEGSVVNHVDGPSSRAISTQGVGDWVGLEELFCTFGLNGKAVRTTGAYGKGDVLLGVVPIEAFKELSRDEPDISWKILRHLVRICLNVLSKRPATYGMDEPASSTPELCLDELLKNASNAFDNEECCRMLFTMSAMSPCWRGFESGDFRVLNKHMTLHRLQEGTFLIRKGEHASFFALVLDGKLTSRSPDGTCIPVTLGSIIGQNALFIGGYREVDVFVPSEECMVAIIRYETLVHFNLSNPDLGSKVMQLVAYSSYVLMSRICLGTTEMDRLDMYTESYLDSFSVERRFETEMKVRKAHLPHEMRTEEMLETWPDIKVIIVPRGGDVLIKGQESTCALYLVEGTVTVLADGKGSQQICEIGPGNYLGALALLQDSALPTERRNADVYAKSDGVILAVLSCESLAEMNYMNPIAGYATYISLIQVPGLPLAYLSEKEAGRRLTEAGSAAPQGTIQTLARSVDGVRRRKLEKATELLNGKRRSCVHKLSNKARAMKMVLAGGQAKEPHSSEIGEGKAKSRKFWRSRASLMRSLDSDPSQGEASQDPAAECESETASKEANNNDLEDPSNHKPEEILDLETGSAEMMTAGVTPGTPKTSGTAAKKSKGRTKKLLFMGHSAASLTDKVGDAEEVSKEAGGGLQPGSPWDVGSEESNRDSSDPLEPCPPSSSESKPKSGSRRTPRRMHKLVVVPATSEAGSTESNRDSSDALEPCPPSSSESKPKSGSRHTRKHKHSAAPAMAVQHDSHSPQPGHEPTTPQSHHIPTSPQSNLDPTTPRSHHDPTSPSIKQSHGGDAAHSQQEAPSDGHGAVPPHRGKTYRASNRKSVAKKKVMIGVKLKLSTSEASQTAGTHDPTPASSTAVTLPSIHKRVANGFELMEFPTAFPAALQRLPPTFRSANNPGDISFRHNRPDVPRNVDFPQAVPSISSETGWELFTAQDGADPLRSELITMQDFIIMQKVVCNQLREEHRTLSQELAGILSAIYPLA